MKLGLLIAVGHHVEADGSLPLHGVRHRTPDPRGVRVGVARRILGHREQVGRARQAPRVSGEDAIDAPLHALAEIAPGNRPVNAFL
jgi:hypothetical protein